MKKLTNFLEKAKSEYYKGNPIIPDEVYDRLEEQLEVASLSVGTMDGDSGFKIPSYVSYVFFTESLCWRKRSYHLFTWSSSTYT